MLRPGERVGDWIIDAPLGEGGMGAVYRVHSALTSRLVAALKVMKPTAEPDARARFVREAEALSALRHPAVVRVMGFSEDPERGLLYLVMELAVGETLRARVARGAMDLPEALATFVPLAQGLDHAHSAGIFHRDLKPSNVVLTVDGTPRLVDFGIAAALEAEPLTTTGQLGTLPYLPPEVFRGERAEPAQIDVYGFGLLLHEALTGERSFAVDPASTPAAAAAAIGVRKLKAPGVELPAGFPDRLRELVRRATDANPAVRPTMRELREGLESAVERRAAGAAPGRMVAVAPPAPAEEEKTTRVPDPASVPLAGAIADAIGITGSRGVGRRRHDRTRSRLLTGAAVAAVLLALALVLASRQPGSEGVAAGSTGRRQSEAGRTPSSIAPALPNARTRAPSPAATDATEGPDAQPTTPARATSPPAPAPSPETRRAVAEPPPAQPRITEVAEPVPPAVERPEEAAPRPEEVTPPLGGRWQLLHEVEATDYRPYAGLRLGYEVDLRQEGDRVYGQGHKVSENGRVLPRNQRTPIDLAGRIEGGQLVLHFTEIGVNRVSRGTIRWSVAGESAQLQGRFATDAANSTGSSRARRAP